MRSVYFSDEMYKDIEKEATQKKTLFSKVVKRRLTDLMEIERKANDMDDTPNELYHENQKEKAHL